MSFELIQFGGGYGSNAGDSALMIAGSQCCVIDLGCGEQAVAASNYLADRWETLISVTLVISHFHADHTNKEDIWPPLKNAAKSVTLMHPEAITQTGNELLKTVQR